MAALIDKLQAWPAPALRVMLGTEMVRLTTLNGAVTGLQVTSNTFFYLIAEVVSHYGYYLRFTPYFISSPRAVPLEYSRGTPLPTPTPSLTWDMGVKVELRPQPK